jgi:hypothetical protein
MEIKTVLYDQLSQTEWDASVKKIEGKRKRWKIRILQKNGMKKAIKEEEKKLKDHIQMKS